MNTRSFRLTRPLMAALALLAAVPALAGEPASVEVDATVPLGNVGPSPSIQAMINGQGPFEFLISVGASRPRLDARMMRSLGIQGGTAVGETVRVNSVTIGDEMIHDIDFEIWNAGMMGRGTKVAGVLNLTFFANHLLTLDLVHQELRLESGSLPAADDAEILEYRLKETGDPGDPDHDTLAIIPIDIDGRAVEAALISRTRSTFQFPSAASNHLPLKSEPTLAARKMTKNGPAEILGSTLDGSLSIGGHAFQTPTVRFSDVFEMNGIGVMNLTRFAITFDHANRRVRFREPSDADAVRYAKAGSVPNIVEGEPDLKTAFNDDTDKTRLVMILSPT